MSNIDKQAVTAKTKELASFMVERFSMNPVSCKLLNEAWKKEFPDEVAIAERMLALLDELEHYKSREERVTKLVLDNSTSWDALYKKLEAAEKRIAELDKRLIEYAGIATREAHRVAELEARAFNPAILDVMAERQRQQSVEGWAPEHDDEHCNGELAMAAVCYINDTGAVNRNGGKPWGWPWHASWWKPDTRRRNLVKAGALILAEIERIDRAAGIKVKGE